MIRLYSVPAGLLAKFVCYLVSNPKIAFLATWPIYDADIKDLRNAVES